MTLTLLILLIGLSIAILFILIMRSPNSLNLEKGQERIERSLKDEISRNREESASNAKNLREEIDLKIKSIGDSTLLRISEIANLSKNQLDSFSNLLSNLTKLNEDKLDKIRNTVEERLKNLQEDNSKKLELMRATVDEKLHSTLEKRLGESFKFVSDRLEMVHKGLGEMQNLASGVGDLKKVLTNIKTRGTWGEIQLENLLDQVLTPEQYEKNVATKKGSSERVEFAIKFPGKEKGIIWLPIDSKFPMEDYQKLVDAQECADVNAIESLGKSLEIRIKAEAKDIKEKYLDPPNTTDFGVLFLPVEGLYAEVLRRTGLCEILQRDYRVIVAGPTTIYALLNSLQMGFRTLAIEKRASEVWSLLAAVKLEFGKFGDILEKTQKKLQEASNTIDDAAKKSRTIERRLNKVQTLPVQEQVTLIGDNTQEV